MAECKIVRDAHDLFVVRDGVKIAKRGRPGMPQAGQWVSLKPGYAVRDSADRTELIVEFKGTRLQ